MDREGGIGRESAPFSQLRTGFLAWTALAKVDRSSIRKQPVTSSGRGAKKLAKPVWPDSATCVGGASIPAPALWWQLREKGSDASLKLLPFHTISQGQTPFQATRHRPPVFALVRPQFARFSPPLPEHYHLEFGNSFNPSPARGIARNQLS